jgi:hypothetical protein
VEPKYLKNNTVQLYCRKNLPISATKILKKNLPNSATEIFKKKSTKPHNFLKFD